MSFSKSDSLKEGEEILLCAFIDDGFYPPRAFISNGIISTNRPKTNKSDTKSLVDLFQMDLSISKGTSGGPIFAIQRYVVGIQSAGVFKSDSSKQSQYSIAISVSEIRRTLDSLKIPYITR
jgi:S1-C subfamily serine protease